MRNLSLRISPDFAGQPIVLLHGAAGIRWRVHLFWLKLTHWRTT